MTRHLLSECDERQQQSRLRVVRAEGESFVQMVQHADSVERG